MKYLFPILLVLSCKPSKSDIVDEQRRTKLKIESLETRIKAAESLQRGYRLKFINRFDTITRMRTRAELDSVLIEQSKIEDMIRDSAGQWDPLKDSLKRELLSAEEKYDSLEFELKKY